MKLKKLNKALVAAGLVAGATMSMPSQAVVMSEDGTGEVLIYPFYTVQGPADAPRTTLFTITNTTADYKAVKVRFHEAHNSRDALDFNLYLSPYDVWTGSVSRTAAGVAAMTTADKSCTIPSVIMTGTNSFSTAAYTQTSNNDGGNQDELRTNEGYIEVIEMGVIDPTQHILATGSIAGDDPIDSDDGKGLNTLGEAILHKDGLPGGAMDGNLPIGCKALQSSFIKDGVWALKGNEGSVDLTHNAVSQPTGGLSGSAMIVQTTLGTVAAYNATALKHFYDVEARANCAAADFAGGLYCETNGQANAATTTNRAFDDLHSFTDLDPATANARSVQTYPNLAMAFPQISSIYNPDAGTAGGHTVLEWSENQLVSSGITGDKANVLFASIKDLNLSLVNDKGGVGNAANESLSAECGGKDGVTSTPAAAEICSNARPVSAVLAKSNLSNEYVLEAFGDSGIDFRTDIVVTFPTKWYFTDNGLYIAADDKVQDGSGEDVSKLDAVDLAPFSSQFVGADTKRDLACERFSINQDDDLPGGESGRLFDREEGEFRVTAASGGLVPSPAINADAPVNQNFFCHESNVLTINDGDLLSSRIANGLDATVANAASGSNSFNIDFDEAFGAGWFKIAFDTTAGGSHRMTSVTDGPMDLGIADINYGITDAGTVEGLPAVGFVAEGLVAGGSAFDGNFTIALPHYTK